MTKYSDLVPDYDEYKRLQTVDYLSWESENAHWKKGQIRYINSELVHLPVETKIVDIGCGDGVGLRQLMVLGFQQVTGIDFCKDKIAKIKKWGYGAGGAVVSNWPRVFEADMHIISELDAEDGTFDVVYASHTLEHAYEPVKALERWKKLLKPGGLMYIVLPYPDLAEAHNKMVHGAKWEIGLTVADGGMTVCEFFAKNNLTVEATTFDNFREDEIWLKVRKE